MGQGDNKEGGEERGCKEGGGEPAAGVHVWWHGCGFELLISERGNGAVIVVRICFLFSIAYWGAITYCCTGEELEIIGLSAMGIEW